MSKKNNTECFLAKISTTIDPLIKKILTKNIDQKFHPLLNYQIETGGKRLRPALVVLSAQLFGAKINQAISAAAALEILHNYTLITDDVIDHGFERRGQPTVWKKFGPATAEVIFMAYAASIFDFSGYASDKQQKINQLLTKTLKVVCAGQFHDILLERSGREEEPFVVKNRYLKPTLNEYYLMIEQKTAFLLASACELGGIIADTSAQNLKYLKQFGLNLGFAFQIQDDILDIFGDQKKFGKQIGKDILEKKFGNIIILLAYQLLAKSAKKEFENIFKKNKITQTDIKKAVCLIESTTARAQAEALSQKFIQQAKQTATKLPNNKFTYQLLELLNFLTSRDH